MFFEFGLSVVGIPRIHVVGISVFVGSRPHGLDVKFFILKLKILNLPTTDNLDLTTTDVSIAECSCRPRTIRICVALFETFMIKYGS